MLKLKSCVRSFKKTLRWLRRGKDTRAASVPRSPADPDLLKLRLLGTSRMIGDKFGGVGDQGSEDSECYIPLHVHGRNMINGVHFIKTLGVLCTGSEPSSSAALSFTPSKVPDLTPIYSDSYLPLKKNTRYTLTLWASTSAKDDPVYTGLCFLYDDGSYSPITLANPTKIGSAQGTAVSLPGKTVKHIATLDDGRGTRRIQSKHVGLYEGVHTSYDLIAESYEGSVEYVTLDEPLHGIGPFSDELDFLSRTVKRRLKRLTLTGDESFSLPEDGESVGHLIYRLDTPMLEGTEALAIGCELLGAAGILSGEYGIAPSEDGTSLLIRLGDMPSDPERVGEHLKEHPVSLLYVRSESITEDAAISFQLRDGFTGIEVRSTTAPRRFYTEYY